MREWYWDCIRILQTSAGVTTRIASVSPERRPAKNVTWGGMDVVVVVIVDMDDPPPEEADDD